MKTRNKLSILLLLFLPLLAVGQTKWNIVDALPQEDVLDLIIKSDSMWAAVGPTVYVSYDGGFGWAFTGPIDEGVEEVYALHIDNETDTVLYAATLGKGIYISRTGGYLWESMNDGLSGYALRVIDIVERRDTLYISTDGAGVYFRPENATQWQPYNDGLGSNIAYSTSAMLATEDALYLGAGGSGYVYFRPTGATEWSFAQIEPLNYSLYGQSFLETNGYVLMSTARGIYRSNDQGRSWERFGFGFNPIEFGLAHYKLDKSGGELFLSISVPSFGAYLFHSKDGGANWYFIDEFVEGVGYVAGRTAQHYFFGTQYGLWYAEADIISDDNEVPVDRAVSNLTIDNIFPNPFDNQLRVTFHLQQQAQVAIAVHDMLGRPVAQLHQGALPAGDHYFDWQLAQLPVGTYQLVCQTPQGIITKPIVKAK